MAEEGKAEAPEGTVPLMILMKNMEAYNLKTGEDIKDVVPWKTFNTEEIRAEIQAKGFYCPFHAIRDHIAKYKLEEILILSDAEEKYGQNWLCCVTEEAFNREMSSIRAVEEAAAEEERKQREAEEAAAAEKARLDAMVYYDEPLTTRAYDSKTAEETVGEVKTLDAQRRRPLLALQIVRPRREFGARVKFLDKDGGEQNAADFRQQRNPNYDLKRAELHVGLQVCAGLFARHESVGTQTTWFRMVNNSMQTEALEMPADAEAIVSSADMVEALATAANRCEHALQQNETLNIFQDELALLDEEEIFVVGNKGENTVREARTFMDLVFSGNTSLVDIDWHPRSRQWLAAATSMNWSFEERVERSGRTTKSHILVYNFSEFSSQIVLESPQEVLTFRWNPSNPTLIAAGCITGQVLLFDLSAAQDVLNRKQKRKSDGGESDKAFRVKPCAVSTIDNSHRSRVAQLEWLPPSVELLSKARGRVAPDATETFQFMTIASDGQVLVWDTRYKEKAAKKATATGASSKANAAKDKGPVELPWLPVYRCALMKGAVELGLCRFALKAGDAFAPLYCGTEEGEIVYADWAPERKEGVAPPGSAPGTGAGAGAGAGATAAAALAAGGDEGDEGPPQRVLWNVKAHHQRPVTSIQRSPFFSDLILSVGDWCFTLWREGLETPLLTSPKASTNVCSGRWSPTRPGVIFIAKDDGSIDIWDLLDQTHKPSLTASVVSTPITSMEFRQPAASRTGKQLLAVGDASGNLHVLEIPQQLRRGSTNEEALMGAYLKREEERVAYVEVRAGVRAEEKEKADVQAALAESQAERLAAAEKDGVDLEEQRRQAEQKQLDAEDKAYAELEASLVKELGITEEYLQQTRMSTTQRSSRSGLGTTVGPDSIKLDLGATGVSFKSAVSATR